MRSGVIHLGFPVIMEIDKIGMPHFKHVKCKDVITNFQIPAMFIETMGGKEYLLADTYHSVKEAKKEYIQRIKREMKVLASDIDNMREKIANNMSKIECNKNVLKKLTE